ncbi:hypothetical protein [Neosynechococcus sphagnicola]|uniref:hypothetical protein n=1 Tax=Neosynechococcus sphagnicola TaxID=1501145 RepID=UPI000689B80A|nr:hypothetical protein [Neosynechococcus sphagnicola]
MILKVEEYRQVAKDSLQLEKFAETQVRDLKAEMGRYQRDLLALPDLQQRHQTQAAAIAQDTAQLQQLQTQLVQLQTQKDQLTVQQQQIRGLETQLQTLQAQINAQHQHQQLLEQAVQRSQQAVQICAAQGDSYTQFLQAETTSQHLEQQRQEQQRLLQQRHEQQQRLSAQQQELTRVTVQLEAFSAAQEQIAQLQPLIQQQAELEQQQLALEEQLQSLLPLKQEQQTLLQTIPRLQTNLAAIAPEISRIQALEAVLRAIPDQEHQRDRLQAQISRLQAAQAVEADLQQMLAQSTPDCDHHQEQVAVALETLEQLRQSLPLGVTDAIPRLQALLQSGVTLHRQVLARLQTLLSDLGQQTDPLHLDRQLQDLQQQLEITYQQRVEFQTLALKVSQQSQWQLELETQQARLQAIARELEPEPLWQQQRSHLLTALADLDNPRSRGQILTTQLQQQPQLQSTHVQLTQTQRHLEQTLTELAIQLATFAGLEAQLQQQRELRQQHRSGYEAYLQAQPEANQLPERQSDLAAAIQTLQTLTQDRDQLQTDCERQLQQYDPQQAHTVETTYNQTRDQVQHLGGGLPEKQKLLAELASQLAHLHTLAQTCDRTQAQLQEAETIAQFIQFARKAYKEAGPRMTERYVRQISWEADKLFRELLNRPNVSLEWTGDYEILVREAAHTRRFINLSGGEQMCAALAVRLALLKVLANIDIAFFDEPTTNMDRVRREQLAAAIAQIRNFRQLFVISHDDTFEQVTENIILVEREV